MSKIKLNILIVLAGIIFYILHCYLNWSIIHSFTASLTAVWVLWLIWDNVLWKFFAGKYGIPVNISGRWQGNLWSSYERGTEKLANITIKQTFSNVSIQIKTNEIKSRSICASWDDTFSSYPCLYYIYRTEELRSPNQVNPPQCGGGKLCVETKDTITINYWTSRLTTGEIKLRKISK